MWYDYALSSYPKYPSSHFKRRLQTLPFLQLIAPFNRMSWLCKRGPQAKQALQQGQSKDALHHTLWCRDSSEQRTFAHFQKVASCSNPSSHKMWCQHVVFKHHSDAQRGKNTIHLLWKEESLGRSTTYQLVHMAQTNPVKNPPEHLLECVQKIPEFPLLIRSF